MTKKDYIAGIEAVTEAYDSSLSDYPIMKGYVNLNNLMFALIRMYKRDNIRFDEDRFVVAWQKSILPLNK